MSTFLDCVQARLIEELEKAGPSEVANASGISRATIYNWMRKGNMPLDKLALLESAGVDVAYALTGQRNSTEASALSQDETFLLENYRKANQGSQQLLLATSAAFASQPTVSPQPGMVIASGKNSRAAGRDILLPTKED